MVRLVDSFPNAWLFRGPAPKAGFIDCANDTSYVVFDTVVNHLKTLSTLPSHFRFIDYNLLIPNRTSERVPPECDYDDIMHESDYFHSHPGFGQFIQRPTHGTECQTMNAFSFNQTYRAEKAKNLNIWQQSQLPNRVFELWNLLHSGSPDSPVVLYVHCEAGFDRTGQIIGSYLMRYGRKDLIEVDDLNHSLWNRCVHPSRRNSMAWYCFYLKETRIRPHIQCDNIFYNSDCTGASWC